MPVPLGMQGASASQPGFVGAVPALSGTPSSEDSMEERAPAAAQPGPHELGRAAIARAQAALRAGDWAVAGQSAGDNATASLEDPSTAGTVMMRQNRHVMGWVSHARCPTSIAWYLIFSSIANTGCSLCQPCCYPASQHGMHACPDDATSPPPCVSRSLLSRSIAGGARAPIDPQRSINPTMVVRAPLLKQHLACINSGCSRLDML